MRLLCCYQSKHFEATWSVEPANRTVTCGWMLRQMTWPPSTINSIHLNVDQRVMESIEHTVATQSQVTAKNPKHILAY